MPERWIHWRPESCRVALGEATKTVPFVMRRPATRSYRFTAPLGRSAANTDDGEGAVVATSDLGGPPKPQYFRRRSIGLRRRDRADARRNSPPSRSDGRTRLPIWREARSKPSTLRREPCLHRAEAGTGRDRRMPIMRGLRHAIAARALMSAAWPAILLSHWVPSAMSAACGEPATARFADCDAIPLEKLQPIPLAIWARRMAAGAGSAPLSHCAAILQPVAKPRWTTSRPSPVTDSRRPPGSVHGQPVPHFRS